MWKTSLPKSEVYFKRTFPSQWMTKLWGCSLPLLFLLPLRLSLFPSFSPPSFSMCLLPKVKPKPGLSLIFSPYISIWCSRMGKGYPCRKMSVLPLQTHFWSHIGVARGLKGMKGGWHFCLIFWHGQPHYRTYHRVVLYLSNLFAVSPDVLVPGTSSSTGMH